MLRSRLFFLIGCWVLFLAALMLMPLGLAAFLGEYRALQSFFSSFLMGSLIGGSLVLGFGSSEIIRTPRLTLLLPLCGVTALAITAGLPFFFMLPDQGLWPSIYEGMSLITTNGTSSYEGTFDGLKSFALWRAVVAWTGGFFAVCIALSFLTAMNIGGMQLHKSPLPFGDSETGYTRLLATALTLYPMYLAVTLLCFLMLWASGLQVFEALTMSMATISTTGLFENYGDGLTNIATQAVLVFFMLLSCLNWDLHYARFKKRRLKVGPDQELFGVLILVVISTFLLTIFSTSVDLGNVWDNIFAAVSAVSTTGVMPTGYLQDSENFLEIGILLMLAAAIGGSVVGTGGGLKQLRAIILFRTGRAEISRLAHPHSIMGMDVGGVDVQKRDIEAVWLLLGSFVLILALGSLALAVLGVHFQDALSMSFTALTLSGPLVSVADPNFGGFSGLRDADYAILSTLMLVGRIESSLLLALFAKSLWRG